MKYYVIYEDRAGYDLNVEECESVDMAEKFVEIKINEHGYRSDEFKVIQGKELPIEVIPARTRVILKTEAL